MHAQSSVVRQVDGLTEALEQLLGRTCGFGLCRQPATRLVITRGPIGVRIERLCDPHARRRAELEHERSLEDEPIPYWPTRPGPRSTSTRGVA